MTAYARIGEHRLQSITVHVPSVGPWWADVLFEGAPELDPSVTIELGGLALSGTIDAGHDGVMGEQRRCRVIAGAGAWGSALAARHYHNDRQVRARTVAEDAAREVGELLGDFAPELETIGVDYVRQAGPASRTLEDVIGSAGWWVGYDGRTHVGARSAEAAAGYEILDVEPGSRVVTLAADELDGIEVGRTLEGVQLERALTIRELEITVTEEGLRVRAWCGGSEASRSRLLDALTSIIDRHLDGRLWGLWRYRVVRMSVDRVELQAVRRSPGLPDQLPISMWPGVAGAHAELSAGAEVLVSFIEGRRTMPIVTHFAGKDGVGWAPANLLLDATTQIDLGAGASSFVALATEADDRLSTIATKFDAHTHLETGGTTDPPIVAQRIGALASVAASKVRAE